MRSLHSPALGPRGCGAPTYSHSWRGRSWFGLNLFQLLWRYVGQATSDGCRVRGLQGRVSGPGKPAQPNFLSAVGLVGEKAQAAGAVSRVTSGLSLALIRTPPQLPSARETPLGVWGCRIQDALMAGAAGGRGTGWVADRRRCANFACLLLSSLCELSASGPSRCPLGRSSKACSAAPSPAVSLRSRPPCEVPKQAKNHIRSLIRKVILTHNSPVRLLCISTSRAPVWSIHTPQSPGSRVAGNLRRLRKALDQSFLGPGLEDYGNPGRERMANTPGSPQA